MPNWRCRTAARSAGSAACWQMRPNEVACAAVLRVAGPRFQANGRQSAEHQDAARTGGTVMKLSVHTRGRGAAKAAAGAVVAGVLTLAACTAGSASGPAGSSSSSPPAGTASPTGKASPAPSPTSSPSSSPGPSETLAGFRVLSMSFVSDQRGFALGTVSCATGRCVALLGTPDGGSSWAQLAAPTRAAGGVYNTCPDGQPCVQQVRFATPLTGYARSFAAGHDRRRPPLAPAERGVRQLAGDRGRDRRPGRVRGYRLQRWALRRRRRAGRQHCVAGASGSRDPGDLPAGPVPAGGAAGPGRLRQSGRRRPRDGADRPLGQWWPDLGQRTG